MAATKVLLLTEIMAPHRVALFNTLAADAAVDLEVVFLARTDPSRRWAIREDEMHFRHRTLREVWRTRRGESFIHLTSGLATTLREARPDVLVVGGWDQPAYLEAFAFRRRVARAFVWWVESTLRDRREDHAAGQARAGPCGRCDRRAGQGIGPSTSERSRPRTGVSSSRRTPSTTSGAWCGRALLRARPLAHACGLGGRHAPGRARGAGPREDRLAVCGILGAATSADR